MLTSIDFYNAVSRQYPAYVLKRINYIRAVDAFISDQTRNSKDMLDVGSGDGQRAIALAEKMGIRQVILLDNSPLMCQISERQHSNISKRVILADITQLKKDFRGKYDIITCLWNVFGHINSEEKRIHALRTMRAKLKNSGAIYFDVNNRYNFKAYRFNALKNIIGDLFHPRGTKGNFPLSFTVNGVEAKTTVHVFSPEEVRRMIHAAGLRISQVAYINYETGARERNWLGGQLVLRVIR